MPAAFAKSNSSPGIPADPRRPRAGAAGRSLLPTLQAVGELGLLEAEQVRALSAAYLFLRRLENLLQAIGDQQTQTLPQDALDQARLAYGMGLADWPALMATLDVHMQAVRAVFDDLIGDDSPDVGEDPDYQHYHSLWQDALEENELAPLTPHTDEEGADRCCAPSPISATTSTNAPSARAAAACSIS